MLSSTLCTITGLYTLSWKLPCVPAKATAASLPNTCAHTMVSASHCVGLTLPGMMDEPGSFSGMRSSPMPQRGPLASQRTSLAILNSAPASVRSLAEQSTSVSCADSAANLLSAAWKGWPVMLAICAAQVSPKRGCAFRPVPTAVPPIANACRPPSERSTPASACSICATQLPISCPSVIGVASCRCVRPVLTTSSNIWARCCSVALSVRTTGSRRCCTCSTTAICMAVGKVSLDDCPRLTWSLGCTGVLLPSSPPSCSMARLAITSLAFMLDCVPEPVWKTTKGKWASRVPSMTSCAAASMAWAKSAGSSPSSALARAAACLRMPRARTIGRVQRKRSVPMGKCSSERWVWAPQ